MVAGLDGGDEALLDVHAVEVVEVGTPTVNAEDSSELLFG